tara:strand:- start:20906 stop:21121 length:216 start_codon:yes stop_codon:yes gene_type:complete
LIIQEFYDKLHAHDWFHEYSDDHRAWTAGNNARKEIEKIVRESSDEFKQLYDKFVEYYFEKRGEYPVKPTA